MKKFRLLFPAFIALAFCAVLMIGSTFALFTSQASASIAVTSGKVKINANFDNLKVYSAKVDPDGELVDENGAHYSFEQQTDQLNLAEGNDYTQFVNQNSGAKLLSENNNGLSLVRMTPGDKVTATLELGNESNVNIKYRVRVNLVSGLQLFEQLQIKLDGVLLQGVQKVGTWTYLSANTDINDIAVEVYFPITSGNDYQELSTEINFVIEAVQGNAATTNETLNTNIKVNQTVATSGNTVVKDDEELVTVTVPAAALNNNITSLTLSVTPTTSTYSTIITSDKASQAYDVKVLEQNSNSSAIKENNEAEIEVNMFVGKDLKGVQLYHNGIAMPTNTWNYNSETGYITFVTTSFSEYTVLYNKDLVVETVTEQGSEFTTYKATEEEDIYEAANGSLVEVNENGQLEELTADFLGSGIESDPYLIVSKASLYKLATLVNEDNAPERSDNDATKPVCYKLTTSVDLTGETWIPMGISQALSFAGQFDGGNHTIKGLSNGNYVGEVTISGTTLTKGETYGFIGFTKGTVIVKNLNFVDANINDPNAKECAIVIGSTGDQDKINSVNYNHTDKLTLQNVHVSGTVIGLDKVAGLVGYLKYLDNVSIDNCSVAGNLSLSNNAKSYRMGGLAGYISTIEEISISNCSVIATLSKGDSPSENLWIGAITAGYNNPKDLVVTNFSFNGVNNDHHKVGNLTHDKFSGYGDRYNQCIDVVDSQSGICLIGDFGCIEYTYYREDYNGNVAPATEITSQLLTEYHLQVEKTNNVYNFILHGLNVSAGFSNPGESMHMTFKDAAGNTQLDISRYINLPTGNIASLDHDRIHDITAWVWLYDANDNHINISQYNNSYAALLLELLQTNLIK